MTEVPSPAYGEAVAWQPERPRFKPLRAAAVVGADGRVALGRRGDPARRRHRGVPAARSLVAAVVAVLNALLPPVLAALRLPFMLALGFVLVLMLNAFVLKLASRCAGQHLRGRQLRLGAARGARWSPP